MELPAAEAQQRKLGFNIALLAATEARLSYCQRLVDRVRSAEFDERVYAFRSGSFSLRQFRRWLLEENE